MDCLAREFNEGNSLDLNFTNQVKDGTKSIDSRAQFDRKSNDSYYKEDFKDAKTNFSDDCGDIIIESSSDKIDEIDVNDGNDTTPTPQMICLMF